MKKRKKKFNVDEFANYFVLTFLLIVGVFILAYTFTDSTDKRVTPDQIELVIQCPEITEDYLIGAVAGAKAGLPSYQDLNTTITKYYVYTHNQFTNTYYLDKVIPAYGVKFNIQQFKYESYIYTKPIFEKYGKLYVRNK